MHSVSGGCHCGNIRIDLELAGEPASYHPRACDCSFCRMHGAAYVSDARGSLRFRIKEPGYSGRYRQGNELAEMLLCTRCGVLIGALFRSEERVYATVNVRVVEAAAEAAAPAGRAAAGFGAHQTVSPQLLSGDQKISRWKELWFGDVEVLETQRVSGR